MLKEVTKNLQATSPTCNLSPLREGMQTKSGENTSSFAMATALATSNTSSLADSPHINGDMPIVDKSPIKLTIKRKNISNDSSSPSPKPDDSYKSDNQVVSTQAVLSDHRHTAINGKILSNSSSTASLTSLADQGRTTSKRASSGGPSATKRPKSVSKRDRNSCGKSTILPLVNSPNLVNGRPNSAERTHDPYQFSVKKEEETVLPPKKLRLDTSLSRLPDRPEPSFKDQGTNTRSQGTSVDHDLLGPCEPGTQINLGGYVCLETLTGMLMVSVRWRNRTYLGTLIDSTSHGFSPPVPPSYIYHTNRYSSAIETGSANSTGTANGRTQRGRGKRRCGFAPSVAARHSRKGRRNNARGSPITVSSVPATPQSINPGDDSNEDSQSRGESPASENPADDGEPSFKCPHPGCHKRFKDSTAGKFHMDECHSKKPCDLPPETNEKRPKPAKATGKTKKHSMNTPRTTLSAQLPSNVKSEPTSVPPSPTVKAETVPIKAEINSSNIPTPFFKTPLNNGVTSPPLLPYSPSSPSTPHLPSSPANGLKHPGNTCSPESLNLPLKLSTAAAQPHIPSQQQHELPVRIPTSNMMVRVGVSSTTGGSSITSASISVNSSSASTPRTVTATTVKTIPVMKPSTVASSSMSSGSSSGKKSNSKESKNNGGIKLNNARSSHTTGTVTASTVTVPAVSSPLMMTTAQTAVASTACPSSLKPIQPKPLVPAASSPNGNKNPTVGEAVKKTGPSTNATRKRKKSSGMASDAGKRQSLSVSGGNSRNGQGKPMTGGKRNSGASSSLSSDSVNAGQGDRASPAYSDISDDNESPIPILEKEGDVKMLVDTTGGCDEVGKTSEQTSGSAAFYNTPPSLVPFSVYSSTDQTAVPQQNANNTGRASNLSTTPTPGCRPNTLVKKSSSPGLPSGKASAPTHPDIPGTTVLKVESGRMNEILPPTTSSISSIDLAPPVSSDLMEKSDQTPKQQKSEDHNRAKKGNEPPNLTKISSSSTSTPTPLAPLALPSSSSVTSSVSNSSSSLPQSTVAKPTPVNPLSPLRSSDHPTVSTPAVVTPGVLVGANRPSDMFPNRPDHLPTPPSFHPPPPGPFGPGGQFSAHLSSPGPLGPQNPFPPYASEMLRFVHPGGPHPGAHPFGAYPYPAEPFFASPPVSSTPQQHKIHELVEKSVAGSSTPSSTSVTGIPSLCTSTSTTPSNMSSKPVEAAMPMDLQTAKSLADMAVAMRHHGGIPNHGGMPQGHSLGGMVPHFPYSGGIPPAHMAAPPFAAMQQHALPPGHPPTPDAFFPPSSILNHHNIYK